MDTDGDGTDNKTDTDDDNDGVLDVNDALPLDPNSSTDNNNDGRASDETDGKRGAGFSSN